MTKSELSKVLELHAKWLRGEAKGNWANLSGSDLRGVDLRDANLRGSDLSNSNLIDAKLRGANLSSSDLSRADLRGANLVGADLICANLSGSDLRYAILRGANLNGSDLSEAKLRGSDLRCADLSRADLRGADLRFANLGGADLRGTDLRGAALSGADFELCHLDQGHPAVEKKRMNGRIEAIMILKESIECGDWDGTEPVALGNTMATSLSCDGEEIAIACPGGWWTMSREEVRQLYEHIPKGQNNE